MSVAPFQFPRGSRPPLHEGKYLPETDTTCGKQYARSVVSNKSGNKARRCRKTRTAVNLMNALDIDRTSGNEKENLRTLKLKKNDFLMRLVKEILPSLVVLHAKVLDIIKMIT